MVGVVLLVATGAQALADPSATAAEPAATAPTGHVPALLRSAVDRLLTGGPIAVSYTVRGAEAGTAEGTGVVDLEAHSYDLAETVSGDGFSFTHERRLVGDTLYIRDVFGDDEPTAEWAEIPYAEDSARELAGALTARGRAVPGLERLVLLVDQLPFEVVSHPDGRTHTLSVPADAVRDFYAETGLQQVQMWDEVLHGHEGHDEAPVSFEIGIGGDGSLAHLRAFGTVFHDGEQLEGADIGIRFSPAKPAAIKAPEERSST
jgi:hypothetical protein